MMTVDVEAAFDWLRKKGQATIAKRDRATKEGLVALAVDGTRGVAVEVRDGSLSSHRTLSCSFPSLSLVFSCPVPALVPRLTHLLMVLALPPRNPPPSYAPSLLQVNSETDFVARNADFQGFVAGAAKTALGLTQGAKPGVSDMEHAALIAVRGREGGKEGGKEGGRKGGKEGRKKGEEREKPFEQGHEEVTTPASTAFPFLSPSLPPSLPPSLRPQAPRVRAWRRNWRTWWRRSGRG
jgi:hypothetical protein